MLEDRAEFGWGSEGNWNVTGTTERRLARRAGGEGNGRWSDILVSGGDTADDENDKDKVENEK